MWKPTLVRWRAELLVLREPDCYTTALTVCGDATQRIKSLPLPSLRLTSARSRDTAPGTASAFSAPKQRKGVSHNACNAAMEVYHTRKAHAGGVATAGEYTSPYPTRWSPHARVQRRQRALGLGLLLASSGYTQRGD